MATEIGVKRAFIPPANKRSFLEVSGEIIEKVDPAFCGDPTTAVIRALASG